VTCPGCVQRIQVPLLEAAVVEDEAPVVASPPAQPRDPWRDDDEEEDFKFKKRVVETEDLDMTPMIDVTFLLLIFFMITASFAIQKSLQTSPPQPEQEGVSQNVNQEELEEQSVVVDIDADNNIRVDDVPIASVAELTDILISKRTAEGKKELLIEVHARSKHGILVAVTDAGLDADMQRIRRISRKDED
jgi:biopolymer transport protein ExbD